MPYLILLSDGRESRIELLPGRATVVGRSVDCDLQISEERASRRHFQVEPSERGWVLADLESSNGTAVNGYGISRALLNPGDVIEVGGLELRFEGDGPVATRAPRPPRKKPSAGMAWVGAMIAILAVAFLTDHLVVEHARAQEGELRAHLGRALHSEFLFASREPDPTVATARLEEFLASHPQSPDAPAARARLTEIRSGDEIRAAAAADLETLRDLAPRLPEEEYRWRLEGLVRRWKDSPEAVGEIRRRLAPQGAPAEQDSRVLFQRRKREADAAAAAGDFARALRIWTAHAVESPAPNPSAENDLRVEVRRIEESAAARGAEVLEQAAALGREGKGTGAAAVLREALPTLEGTGAGRRLAAMLRGAGTAGLPSALGPGAAGGKGRTPDAAGEEGYARRRELYLAAREAEQFVALRDYAEASRRYAAIAASAASYPEVRGEMDSRSAELQRTADLLDSLRSSEKGWKGRPWPETWDAAPPEDIHAALARSVKTPEQRLVLASFDYDQGLRKEAAACVAAALESESTHAAAERLYAEREGVPIPEGGFVADKGEILGRDEWKRRRNAEAIAKLRDRQEGLLKRLRGSSLVRTLDRLGELRAELDRRRAHALELIFDEVKYFYPYRDRMAEYTPVQMEVDRRVEAVREVWESKVKVSTREDSATAAILRDLDEAAGGLRDLGAAEGPAEKEVARLRTYLDRDLDVRSYFRDEAERERFEANAATLKDNAERKTVAADPERRQVEITNEYRIMFGRRALAIHDRLVLSARAHGDDMSRGGFFSHFNERLLEWARTKKGTVPEQACGCSSAGFVPGCSHGPDARIHHQGYEFMACSENIHSGSGDPQGAHNGWIHSSGHHRNILSTAWKEMGTGQVGRYWTQNFGLPLDAAAAAAGGGGDRPWDDR